MRQRTYLNVILTINAVLLTGLLWTQIVNGPALVRSADAANAAMPQVGSGGIPNAGQQRQEMIKLLKSIDQKSDRSHQLLDSGRLRVRVTNIDELRITDTAIRD